MEEEKKEIQPEGGQPPQKGLGELFTPIANISDDVVASKEGGIFLRALYQDANHRASLLQKKLEAISNQKIELEKQNIVLEQELKSKTFLDFFQSILLAVAVVLVEIGIKEHYMFIWIIGIFLVIISLITTFKFVFFKKNITNKEIK
jgi:hypothetical protein